MFLDFISISISQTLLYILMNNVKDDVTILMLKLAIFSLSFMRVIWVVKYLNKYIPSFYNKMIYYILFVCMLKYIIDNYNVIDAENTELKDTIEYFTLTLPGLVIFRIIPLIVSHAILFSFIGYIIDLDNRKSGKWYADIFSTLGFMLGVEVGVRVVISTW